MTNLEVEPALQIGYRMPKPAGCDDEMYSKMRECWKQEPEDRPTFKYLKVDKLLKWTYFCSSYKTTYIYVLYMNRNISKTASGHMHACIGYQRDFDIWSDSPLNIRYNLYRTIHWSLLSINCCNSTQRFGIIKLFTFVCVYISYILDTIVGASEMLGSVTIWCIII